MRPYRRGWRVVVHTRDGHSIEGVLDRVYRAAFVLKGARLLSEDDPEGEGTTLGEIVIDRDNHSFTQVR